MPSIRIRSHTVPEESDESDLNWYDELGFTFIHAYDWREVKNESKCTWILENERKGDIDIAGTV